MLTHVDLFSGIGGFSLAAEWAGYTTVLFVEKDKYCQAVLQKHWPNVPIIGDIRDVNEETVAHAYSEGQPDVSVNEGTGRRQLDENRDGAGLPTIDLLTGGFPCQPFSVAGRRGGKDDDRYLWPEMLRVIALLKPRWVLAENVAGIINMALDDVLSDLEGEGYETGTVVLPACAVNAPHRRDRVWIVAHCDDGLSQRQEGQVQAGRNTVDVGHEDVADTDSGRRRTPGKNQVKEGAASPFIRGYTDAADTSSTGLEGLRGLHSTPREVKASSQHRGGAESRLGRALDGLPERLDRGWDESWESKTPRVSEVRKPDRNNRLKCLGNAIVPQVAYEILKGIRLTEIMIHEGRCDMTKKGAFLRRTKYPTLL